MITYFSIAFVVGLLLTITFFTNQKVKPKDPGEAVTALTLALLLGIAWPITATACSLIGIKKAVDKLKS